MLKKAAKILARIILTVWVLVWFVYLSSYLTDPREAFIRLGLLTVPVALLTFGMIFYSRDRPG